MAVESPMLSPLSGFGPLLRKEFADARRSKRLIAFTIVMTLALCAIPVIAYSQVDTIAAGGRHRINRDDMENMVATWAGVTGYLGALMVIAATIDAVTRERAPGVTAWIVTKPVSRMAYLLAKATGHAIGGIATVVVIPSAAWLVRTIALFQSVPMANVLGAAAILCVEIAFISFANVALGVPLKSVTPIAVLSLALWFLPTILPVITRFERLYYVLPSYLPIAAVGAAYAEDGDGFVIVVPFASALIAGITFMVAADWFERQEL